MSAVTLNVSLSKEQLTLIQREVESGQYTSPGEVIREALRLWMEHRTAAELAALEQAHAGAWERDTTPEEEASILRIQKKARAQLLAGPPRKPAVSAKNRRK